MGKSTIRHTGGLVACDQQGRSIGNCLRGCKMDLVRFNTGKSGRSLYGVRRDDHIQVIAASPFDGMVVGTSEEYSIDEVELLAPCTPSKIVAVGLNYRDHAEELGMPLPEEPLLFLKPPSSIIGPGATIVLPDMSSQVEHEAELAIIIGSRARNITPELASDFILGYTCLNDVTARDLQKRDIQFTRSKSFDTFCPLGPWITTDIDPADLQISCLVNNEIRQESSTGQLVHGVNELVSFVSRIMTLEPGDIISTGTPVGVGRLEHGDEVVVRIEGIGELKNRVE